ncbi:hypothetical protein Agabi119p4_4154 [Agaricus bisporus var. burnettii]|uniref:Uncharacterized protein n=1 Tax=Agaricus bisporus var. burnettii TaxID=192524 RepID=A0A8H7F2S4_AGABI|nr:hypothetical protein Agabi119p4_4154 [Agaricus bisporus var. burnettii]
MFHSVGHLPCARIIEKSFPLYINVHIHVSPPGFPSPQPVPNTKAWKLHEDRWMSNPPQVKSYLAYSTASGTSGLLISENEAFAATSPNCGFGWRFRFNETFNYVNSVSNRRVQELVGRVDLTLEPNLCSSMPLSKFMVNVKVSYPSSNAKATQGNRYIDVSLRSETQIGTYTEPSGYNGQIHVEVTLGFSRLDGLSLPTTSSMNTRKALRYTLDGPSFADAKFYLFSARVQGRAARPKVIFAKSGLLIDSSTYLHDLLSTESGFAGGTSCDLLRDAPKEIAKLDADAYDYDSDSDLEEEETGGKVSVASPSLETEDEKPDIRSEELATGSLCGRAFAINGTAYKTWKAFIYYSYTNDIHFSALRSEQISPVVAQPSAREPDSIRCSPKSMYRFAEYANLPELMSLAKEAIKDSLCPFNIVKELFSRFTSRYQEIIDLEIHYLVTNFTPAVARDFDQMLEEIVAGGMPHCGNILKLSIRRLRHKPGPKAKTKLDSKFDDWAPVRTLKNTGGRSRGGDKIGEPPGELTGRKTTRLCVSP